MDLNPNQLVKSNSIETSFPPKREDSGKDDDDPLSIRGKSITIFGILLAAMTILIPSVSVFLERPLLQDYGVISKQRLKKDGY